MNKQANNHQTNLRSDIVGVGRIGNIQTTAQDTEQKSAETIVV
jgi:hypothetical protein